MISLWLCKRVYTCAQFPACLWVCLAAHDACGYWHVKVGSCAGSVHTGLREPSETTCLLTVAKHAAAKETKVQLLSFLQPQSVANHMRRDGIPREDYSLIGSC